MRKLTKDTTDPTTKSVTLGTKRDSEGDVILNLSQAAKYLQVSRATLEKMVTAKTIPCFQYPGVRGWKFKRNILDQWTEEQSWRHVVNG